MKLVCSAFEAQEIAWQAPTLMLNVMKCNKVSISVFPLTLYVTLLRLIWTRFNSYNEKNCEELLQAKRQVTPRKVCNYTSHVDNQESEEDFVYSYTDKQCKIIAKSIMKPMKLISFSSVSDTFKYTNSRRLTVMLIQKIF